MESSFFAISLGLLLISPLVLSDINIVLNYDTDLKETMGKKFDIKGSINLHCKVTATENEKFTVKWEKDNQEVKNKADSSERFIEKYEGNNYNIKITRAVEDDAGTYFCIAFINGEEVKRENITLFSRYRVKTPGNLNFVEGEILRITCIVHGKPAPEISWKIGNETYTESRDRIILENDTEKQVEKAILVIKEAEMGDRGVYTCIATTYNDKILTHETMVRIKDKYAALWPFLGICAEVFILCAIILIYEKKRNKAELEESDTDQSPDQKNTPDHGKDSNLRHRQ